MEDSLIQFHELHYSVHGFVPINIYHIKEIMIDEESFENQFQFKKDFNNFKKNQNEEISIGIKEPNSKNFEDKEKLNYENNPEFFPKIKENISSKTIDKKEETYSKEKEEKKEYKIENIIENRNKCNLNNDNSKNKFYVFKLFNPSGQSETNKEIRQEINRIIKRKKCNKNNKFKVTDIELVHKKEYKRKRKSKPDDVRKKIKSRFLKSLKNMINIKLNLANSEKFFDLLPQCFISSITKKRNDISILNMTFKEIMSTDFFKKYGLKNRESFTKKKRKKDIPDKQKYENNMNVIRYIEENEEIFKNTNFDVIQKMTYSELFDEYLKSKEFEEDILKLKMKEEEKNYINDYILKANNFINYFSKSK